MMLENEDNDICEVCGEEFEAHDPDINFELNN